MLTIREIAAAANRAAEEAEAAAEVAIRHRPDTQEAEEANIQAILAHEEAARACAMDEQAEADSDPDEQAGYRAEAKEALANTKYHRRLAARAMLAALDTD